MANKITIIGAGSVGSTIAYSLANRTIASDIVIIDINKSKAEGEAMDILQGTAFRDPITVSAGNYADAKDSSIVIIACGISRKPGQTRLDLTRTNVGILRSIIPEIVKEAPDAKYIIVSNPVDILTYVFTKESGLPESQIIGTGTLLDTARLRSCLAEMFSISQRNIHAFVFGEHGDSSFVPWSMANVAGVKMDKYHQNYHTGGAAPMNYDDVLSYVRTSGGQIIKNKGATFYAIAMSVCRLCEVLTGAYDSVITVSSIMHGEYGIEDVCLSVPCIVGPDGLRARIELDLTNEEIGKLNASADALKTVIKDLEL